ALVAARSRHCVTIWARDPSVSEQIQSSRRNPFYLSDFELPEAITATSSLRQALEQADLALIAVPSHSMRVVLQQMLEHLEPRTILVSATKGVENGTLMRMTEVITDVVNNRFEPRIVALSGPSFSREVAREDPTAIVAASNDSESCETVQRELSG